MDFLLKNRHLHLRANRPWCIGRIRHTVIDAIRRFFNDNGFTLVDTPIFTTAAGEGEQTLFEVDYFGQPMFLSQTGQFYLECAAMSFGKVYCFGPTFRAEKSKTRRHLTEFWMVEPEVAFIDLPGLLELAENFVSCIVERVLKTTTRNWKHLEPILRPGKDHAAVLPIDLYRGGRYSDERKEQLNFWPNSLKQFKQQKEDIEKRNGRD